MSMEYPSIVSLLRDIMRRQKRLPSQLATDLGISHTTVSRWLSGKHTPSIKSCHKLAQHSSIPLPRVLSATGHLPRIAESIPAEWPEFREYAMRKYPGELDDDLITMIEDLIERRRQRRRSKEDS